MAALRLLLRLFLLRLCALLTLVLGVAPAHADTPIALFASYDGRMNFTGTQVTWRAYANSTSTPARACTVYTPTSTLSANLTIPVGATVVAAHLYWAGSGTTADYNVLLQGTAVSATRRHTSTTVGGGITYFGAGADVTSIVKTRGSGAYSFSGLTIANGEPWCGSQAVLGGFSLLVVYSHPSEPERVLNLYEGFRYVQNSTVNVSASNFRWASPAFPVVEKARVGHITWEGDTTLSGGGEKLLFEGKELTDTMNPSGNQFNSRSNINGDNNSFGVDFDAYDTTVTIWSGYDAVVDTSYQTGQDLVLLGAEVLLVPTLPVSDMSVSLVGPTELQVSVPANFKIVLTNNGPYTAPGPLVATQTLPAGMSFSSFSGTNWACSASGQVVTCTYTGAVAPGTSSTELTVTTAVTTVGEKINKVVVSGADDDKPANNSATHTATAKAAPPPPVTPANTYVFTYGVCKVGVKIGATGSGCTLFETPRDPSNPVPVSITAGATQPIFVTALDANGVPMALSKTVATPVKMRFSLTCTDPATGSTSARYANVDLPACNSSNPWSPEAELSFSLNTASVAANFTYPDVGSVRLNLLQGTTTASTRFVSPPWKLAFRSIARESDNVVNPVRTTPATPSDPGFAMAGEQLKVEVVALVMTSDNSIKLAPNFGAELKPEVRLELGDLNTDSTKANYQKSPGELISLADPTWNGGVRTFNVAWSEVGVTTFLATLPGNSYLGVPDISGASQFVGPFYPAYYDTDLGGPFSCPLDDGNISAVRRCAEDAQGIVPAVYAGQEFTGIVVPRNTEGDEIKNFVGDWYKPVTLTAVASSGGAVLGRPFAKIVLPKPVVGGKITATLTYTLASPYLTAAPRANNWTAPTAVFLRAASDDTRIGAAGTNPASVQIRSLRGDEGATTEGGIVVINGRLKVNNALGTDVLRTPVGVRAEYWNGAAWVAHVGYADMLTPVPPTVASSQASFTSCTRSLATAATPPNNCQAIVAGDVQAVNLVNGAGVVWMRRPGKLASGRSRDGSVNVQLDYRTWLPSTVGRVTFGTYRSTLIYVREVY